MALDTVADVAFFVLGVGIILFTLLRRSNTNHPPIELTIEKLGSLKIDFVAYLISIGILVSGVGLYFRWRAYEKTIEELTQKETQMDGTINEVREQVARFKNYDLRAALDFQESVTLQQLTIHSLVKKPEGDWREGDGHPAPSPDAANLVNMSVSSLNPGDRVKFKVEQAVGHGSQIWRSPEIEVPVFSLRMEKNKP